MRVIINVFHLLNDISINLEGSSEFRMRLNRNRSILRVIASMLNAKITGPLTLLEVGGEESTSGGTWNSQDSSSRANS